jgi:hypothetical protein
MNFSLIFNRDRRTGRTTAIADAARSIGAIVLAASFEDAVRITKQHGVPATNIMRGEALLQADGPFLADHYAVEQVCLQYEVTIDRLTKQLADTRALVHEINDRHATRSDELIAARAENKQLKEQAAVCADLAAWSLRYPRASTYSHHAQPQMDGELIALETRAKALIQPAAAEGAQS